MAEFYFRVAEEIVGPISGVELREAAHAGIVKQNTRVANDPKSPGIPAGKARGLFSPTGKPLPHPAGTPIPTWYVKSRKGEAGPYRLCQMLRLAQQGKLGAASQVRQDGVKNWGHLSDVSVLFSGVLAEPTDVDGVKEDKPRPSAGFSDEDVISFFDAVDAGPGVAEPVSSPDPIPQPPTDDEPGESEPSQKTEPKRPYYEVLGSDGAVRQYPNITHVRYALLRGEITRWNQARHVCSKPDIVDDGSADEFNEMLLEDWKEDTTWRRIGDGLARREDEILVLYHPALVCVRNGAAGAALLCALIAIITCFFFGSEWTMFWESGGGDSGRLITPSAPGRGAILQVLDDSFLGTLLGWLFAWLWALFVSALLGMATGSLPGAALGMLHYVRNHDSFPRPPEDSYRANVL